MGIWPVRLGQPSFPGEFKPCRARSLVARFFGALLVELAFRSHGANLLPNTYTWSNDPNAINGGVLLGSWGVDTATAPAAPNIVPPAGGMQGTYQGSTTITGGTLQIPGYNAAGIGGMKLAPTADESSASSTLSGTGTVVPQGTTATLNVVSGSGTLFFSNGGLPSSAPVTADVPAQITRIPCSPVFYIIVEGAAQGDSVRTVPCTGKETVLSAVSAINGISQVSGKKMWIARPSAKDHGKSEILPINWIDIARGGIETTNYALQPNDRLVFGEDATILRNNLLGKYLSPVERVLGIVSLTTSTIGSLNSTPGAKDAIKELVNQGVFDDEPQMKKLISEAIARESEDKPSGAKAESPKTDGAAEKPSATSEAAANRPATGELKLVLKVSTEPAGQSSPPKAKAVAAQAAPAPKMAMKPLPDYRIRAAGRHLVGNAESDTASALPRVGLRRAPNSRQRSKGRFAGNLELLHD